MPNAGPQDAGASLIDLIGHPVGLLDLSAAAATLNPAACRLLGRSFAAGAEIPLDRAIGRSAAEALARFAEELPSNGAGAVIVLRCETAAGERCLSFEVTRRPPVRSAFVLALREESADASAIEALAKTHAVLQTLPVGVEIFDLDFNALFYNRKSDELFDYADAPVANHDAWWRLAFPDAGARAQARAEWREVVAEAEADPSRAHVAEWTVRCKDGESRTIQFFYRFLFDRFSLVLWDVTEQRRLEGELRATARTDGLTGLPNRRRFFERADEEILSARIERQPVAVLMLDIDHFKAINDGFGHVVGDLVLKVVAERASAALRREDMIARLGGEEFAALLPRAGPSEARRVAERLRKAIVGQPVTAASHTLAVTISVGGAVREDGAASSETMVERADRALYAAKSAGRNRVVFDEDD
ncbi:GGDEF domain-containing protein [Hansschlegelia sp. KR7-227]|uniref:GGDEF domain-containing protein n=1 Tax=Hansschlegelia sp. KR7-227 TaxID=3400914 RepID=UPI003C04A9E3